jgi:hypothetical protein
MISINLRREIAIDHDDQSSEVRQIVWWAESDDLDGFTASHDSLKKLMDVCKEVISEEFDLEVDEIKFNLVGERKSTLEGNYHNKGAGITEGPITGKINILELAS